MSNFNAIALAIYGVVMIWLFIKPMNTFEWFASMVFVTFAGGIVYFMFHQFVFGWTP